ncbi:MAG: serine hydrolase [Deltaproteobacteria bacterium]|nr:serine hydrolase [Deltaproteobacteria bacterium]
MKFFGVFITTLAMFLPILAHAYPTDQFERTQIRRLKWQHDVDTGKRRGRKTPPGAQWPCDKINLKMLDAANFHLNSATPKDTKLQKGLVAILRKSDFRNYHVALLDITDPQTPRYAAVNEEKAQTPGSVAKILIGAALMQELKDRFGDDIGAREKLLREVSVAADDWAMPNSHEVPVINGDKVSIRRVLRGDTFTLWEWLDHMLSPSSNASASMVWREVTLMHLLKKDYPPSAYNADLWARFDRDTLTAAAYEVIEKPLINAGIDPENFQLRLFFTKGASKYVKPGRTSLTPLALLQWMVAVEQGRMVDKYSSLELKRMLYLTRRRIRYSKNHILKNHAVFFKSGSFYRCKPEPDFVCQAYQGNVINVLNALVEVETAPESTDNVQEKSATIKTDTKDTNNTSKKNDSKPVTAVKAAKPLVYIITVMSNELRRSSADEHERLAGYIHNLILKQNM